MSQLHILNGDATLQGFNDTGIDGDVLVWREVFSEGPLAVKLDADFWHERQKYTSVTFNDTPDGYEHKVLYELEKLNQPYIDITLWFDFDLHCQVNMLGVMQLLQQQVDLSGPEIYLICPDYFPGVLNFKGMGQLTGKQLEVLYDNRLHLGEYDFKLASEAWRAYNTFNADKLDRFIDSTPFWGGLHQLKFALEAQVRRLEVNEQGLNYIEEKLLLIYQNGIINREGIYEAFWRDEAIYGMGDAEINTYLNRLQQKGLITLV
ncbi:DUF1835 domain-containing protein [uncultured Mucilaginibacter sp.]|uniref:DUF1835 domain-containing protein n=1 Tax=uncultured Mucilaginibacter sp. TaxID=797541 RepID=UPI0025E0E45B|nr:DUF1835 domain-containing protein [uncultured Mucilaginibacter sp.]